jgi:adenylate kinase family enzyme
MVSLGIIMELFMFGMQVIDYYSKKSIVANLHAEKSPKEVTAEVQKVLS